MSKKVNRAGIISALVILVCVLVIFNVCTFAIPYNKVSEEAFYTAYGCGEFVILAQMILIILQLFVEEKPNQKIIGLPIIYFGYITLVVQLIATGVFYAINAFVGVPLWTVILIECLIIGLGIIQISIGFFFKKRNENYHENIANTKFMDEFRSRLKALKQINKNENISVVLEDLLDKALGSDPITNEKTIDSETELLSLLQELDTAIKCGSEEESRKVIEKIKDTLIERNVMCKTGK